MEKILLGGKIFIAEVTAEKRCVGNKLYYQGTMNIAVIGTAPFSCNFTTDLKAELGSLEQELISFEDTQSVFVYDKEEVYDYFLEKMCEQIIEEEIKAGGEIIVSIAPPKLSIREMEDSGFRLFGAKAEFVL